MSRHTFTTGSFGESQWEQQVPFFFYQEPRPAPQVAPFYVEHGPLGLPVTVHVITTLEA